MFTSLFSKYISNYHIVLYNKEKDQYALATSGFSYTFLFLIFSFPSLLTFFRRDYKNMFFLWSILFIFALLTRLTPNVALFYLIGYYLCLFYIAFSYNKWYLQSLIAKGYVFAETLAFDNTTNSKVKFILQTLNEQEILKAVANHNEENAVNLDANNNHFSVISSNESSFDANVAEQKLLKIMPKLKSYFIKRFLLTIALLVAYVLSVLNLLSAAGYKLG